MTIKGDQQMNGRNGKRSEAEAPHDAADEYERWSNVDERSERIEEQQQPFKPIKVDGSTWTPPPSIPITRVTSRKKKRGRMAPAGLRW